MKRTLICMIFLGIISTLTAQTSFKKKEIGVEKSLSTGVSLNKTELMESLEVGLSFPSSHLEFGIGTEHAAPSPFYKKIVKFNDWWVSLKTTYLPYVRTGFKPIIWIEPKLEVQGEDKNLFAMQVGGGLKKELLKRLSMYGGVGVEYSKILKFTVPCTLGLTCEF